MSEATSKGFIKNYALLGNVVSVDMCFFKCLKRINFIFL